MNKLLILIETENDELAKVSMEIIAHAANCFQDIEINGLLLTVEEHKESLINALQNKGLDNLFISIDKKFKEYSPQACTATITDFLKHNPQNIFLLGATPTGREIAPRVAARMDLGLTADCTEIDIDENCVLLATRPTYGGQLMATIVSKTSPNFATIRPGALKSTNTFFEKPINIFNYNANLENIIEAIKVIKTENKTLCNHLETAEIIIAGGIGMKTKENFDLIIRLAELIGAKPAASRAAVELGWALHDIQVGQTGHTVAPKLYIALGISGAMQHLVGISNSDRIIAVNTDRSAPVFEAADIGIVADAPEFVKALIKRLEGC